MIRGYLYEKKSHFNCHIGDTVPVLRIVVLQNRDVVAARPSVAKRNQGEEGMGI